MGPDGEAIVEYLGKKYGRTPEQIAETQAMIRDRGASVGFAFGPRTNVYNTFDAHRLLHWAGLEGRQLSLKQALLKAYHGEGRDPSNHDVLVAVANRSGSMVRVRVRCCKAATMPTRCARPSAKTSHGHYFRACDHFQPPLPGERRATGGSVRAGNSEHPRGKRQRVTRDTGKPANSGQIQTSVSPNLVPVFTRTKGPFAKSRFTRRGKWPEVTACYRSIATGPARPGNCGTLCPAAGKRWQERQPGVPPVALCARVSARNGADS